MVTDPIADLLTRIRNAVAAKQIKTEMPASRLKIGVVRILKDEGYITNYRVAEEDGKGIIKVYLKYTSDSRPVISKIERVSMPGRRVYVRAQQIPRVIGGLGINILTTSHGVMTGKQAQEKGVGGELLCNVY